MHYKHLVIVHGIGDQLGNKTSISFMNEFIRVLPPKIRDTVDVRDLVERIDFQEGAAARPAYVTLRAKGENYVVAFSEVYWQPVPNDYSNNNNRNPPVPWFTWLHSINTRIWRAGPKYKTARSVIDNLERMLGLLKRLATIDDKSGILLGNVQRYVERLAGIVNRFLCEVQMYIENEDLRDNINQRFLSLLKNVGSTRGEISRRIKEAGLETLDERTDIYVVSHSEGTVMAYNSLVKAAQERESDHAKHAWISSVRTLVTLGSPLDRHYAIWRDRFRTDILKKDPGNEKIRWRNYWDRNDPVGCGLQVLFPPGTASDAAQMFAVVRDASFARYPVPWKAHVDYWKDDEIHADIISEVLEDRSHRSKVMDKWWQPLQVPLDYAAYVLGRLVTLALVLFFANKIISPVHKWMPAEFICSLPGFPCDGLESWQTAVLLLTVPLALNGFLEIDRDWQWGWLQSIHKGLWKLQNYWLVQFSRWLLTLAWVWVALFLCVGVTQFDPKDGFDIKDWIEYPVGLVVSILVWRLHTTVHSGLLQTWRYTGGAHTAYLQRK
jgi:hypothetical protein